MSKPIKKLLASLLVMPVIVGLNSSLKLNKEEIRARALSGDVVISEVFAYGGESGIPLMYDFIELYNNTAYDIDLTNWVIWYAPPASSFSPMVNEKTNLQGTIKAKSYYLIQEQKGTGGYNGLPPTDVVGTIQIGYSYFKLALTNTSALPTLSTSPNVVDFIGAGAYANDYETASAPQAALQQSISRTLVAGLMVDSNNNASDFKVTSVTPTSSMSPIIKTASEQASEFADFVVNTEGLNANGKCEAVRARLDFVYTRISDDARLIVDTSLDSIFVDARARMSYLSSWFSTTPKTVRSRTSNKKDYLAIILIGLTSITSLLVFVFLKKKNT